MEFQYTDWMKKAAASKAGIRVIAGGRRCGKTSFLIDCLLEHLLAHPGGKVALFSPNHLMAGRVVLPMIREKMQSYGLKLKRGGARWTELDSGTFYHAGWDFKLEGLEFELAAIDEADYQPEPIKLVFHAKLLVVVGTSKVRRKQDRPGWFERWYKNGRPGQGKVRSWSSWRVPSSGFIPAADLERLRESMTPSMFKAEYEGRFVSPTKAELRQLGEDKDGGH